MSVSPTNGTSYLLHIHAQQWEYFLFPNSGCSPLISSVVKYSSKSSEGHRFDSCSERSNFFRVHPRSPSEMHSSHELPIAQWQSIRTSYWKVIGSSPCSEFSDICPSLSETASKTDIS